MFKHPCQPVPKNRSAAVPGCGFLHRLGAVASECLAILALTAVLSAVGAETVTLIPDADATLMQAAPSNSMGGAEYIIAGTTQNGTRVRGLMRFDIAGNLPAGARITGVTIDVAAIKQSGEAPVGASYGLHRMLTSWGEGTVVPGVQPGLGEPAEAGDATWNARFFPSTNWSAPGAAAGTDYSAQVSSSAIIDSLGVYTLEPTFELIADVQNWLDHPESNFGWMLKCESEETRFTARQFASRQFADTAISPQLTISYEAPIAIKIAKTGSSAVTLSFAVPGGSSYAVETRSTFSGTNAWQTLTNFGFVATSTVLTAGDNTSLPQRFYRVRAE